IDQEAKRVYLDHREISLTVKEYELLLLLAQNPGKTLHKEYLFNRIWGIDSDSEYQTLTVHIKMLRDKIEEDPKNPRRIRTVWGIGYSYEEI
ncbi:MAG: winged helix-turn-helix domain-containing protein, partial [Lachnospiraceae bacterium]|nr:winged helix-turn-helix domain-containing protein [Lachnospiraceae bacterium]